MSVKFNIHDFISYYDVSAYKGGKVKIDQKNSLKLVDLAKIIGDITEKGKLSPAELQIAHEKLSKMQQIRLERKENPVKNIFTSVFPLIPSKTEKDASLKTHTNRALTQITRQGSGIEQAVQTEARDHMESLMGAFDQHIDSQFSSLPLPPNQPIMIHVREDNGLGDILYCIKTMKALKEKYPEVALQISVETRTIKVEEVVDRIKKEGADLGAMTVFPFNQRPADVRDPALMIIMPDDPSPQALKAWHFEKPPQRLMLKEYGFGEALQSGGLSDCSLGIFLEPSLTQLETPTGTNGEIISRLSNAQAKNAILQGQDPKEYQANNKLYFGYAHTTHPTAGFLKSMIAFNGNDGKNIDFFLRTQHCTHGVHWQMEMTTDGLVYKSFDHLGRATEEERIPFDFLAKHGFGSIEVVKIKREHKIENLSLPGGRETIVPRYVPVHNSDQTLQIESSGTQAIPGATGGKVLRILDLFPIPHSDVLKLNQASEPEILVSGNQSFGEAVSAKKCFFYEIVPHGRTFAAQMRNLGNRVDPEFSRTIGLMQCDDKPMDYQAVVQALRDPKNHENFRRYGNTVQQDYNLAPRLEGKVKRLMWAHHSEPIANHLKTIDASIQKLSKKREEKKDTMRVKQQGIKIYNPIATDKGDFDELLAETADSVFWLQSEISKQL